MLMAKASVAETEPSSLPAFLKMETKPKFDGGSGFGLTPTPAPPKQGQITENKAMFTNVCYRVSINNKTGLIELIYRAVFSGS